MKICKILRGGNLRLETKQLLVKDGAIIDASTFGRGQAGNISIDASDIVEIIGVSPDQNIVSGVFAKIARDAVENTGDVGSLMIHTSQLFGLVELPSGLTDASQQIASSCNPGVRARGNSFSVTGRSGMAPSPTEALQADVSTGRWITLDAVTNKQSGNISTAINKIVEAQGWVKDKNGDVILVARANALPHGLFSSHDSCH